MSNIVGVVLFYLFSALWWAVLIRVLLSWLPMAGIQIDPYNPAIKILTDITDPILEPLRRYATIGMIDWSPFIALIVIGLLRNVFSGFL